MMWLNDEGVIGEIECIFPAQIDNLITLWEEKYCSTKWISDD